MGVQVAVTLDTQLKPNYVVSTVLTAAFAPANGELVLWIGNAYAKVASPFRKDLVTGAFDAVAALPGETYIGIWYGSLFQPLKGSTVTPHVLRALEKYLETTQKAA
jgi:hypothetical protein